MPTLSSSAPHHHRRLAESFGVDAERYDRTRPSYPQALIDWIVATGPGPHVLDVGTGTGIAARLFQAAGCDVLGVEIDERMAAFARRAGVDVEVARFEEWDPAGRTYDAVVSGQSWHWIDPAAGAARAAEALRPGGLLAVFWNVHHTPPDVASAFAEVYTRVVPRSLSARGWSSAGDGAAALSDRAADGIRAAGAFREPEHWRFDWDRRYTRDEWLDQLPTHGDHSQFTPAELEDVLAGVGAAIDAIGGSFTMRYAAVVTAALRVR